MPFDITTLFGAYSYLVSEFVFGTIGLALCLRAAALRRAIRTIAVLYPVAYFWDWYTLEIGIFEITLRTGVDFLGIPIEEHIFMVVVPLLVIGVHETLLDTDRQSLD